jgi:cystathionine beta-lyase/cystathionine gamma-synthase
MTKLEGGAGALACTPACWRSRWRSRRRWPTAAGPWWPRALYGATIRVLLNVLEPRGVQVRLADACDADAFEKAVAEQKPGCILL